MLQFPILKKKKKKLIQMRIKVSPHFDYFTIYLLFGNNVAEWYPKVFSYNFTFRISTDLNINQPANIYISHFILQ